MMDGRRVESWTHKDQATWVQTIGKVTVLDGEVVMLFDDADHIELHQHPPCPTESDQVWRLA